MSTKSAMYLAYHRMAPRIQSDVFQPIQVGCALKDERLVDMIADDTGKHISDRNPAFCELTALYWAWKNDLESPYIGLLHYRRLLDFCEDHPEGPAEINAGHFEISEWMARSEQWIESNIASWDLVIPEPHQMVQSLRANYCERHLEQDLNGAREIIASDHPDYLSAFDAAMEQNGILLGNIAIMRRDLFNDYCEWLFDILFKVEALPLDRQHYSPHQSRYIGFLAERLFNVYVEALRQRKPDLRILQRRILNLSQACIVPYLDPNITPDPKTVNLALATDRRYLPHAAATLRSVLDHFDPKRRLNIYFLYSGIDADTLELLNEIIASHPLAEFHPIHTGDRFATYYRSSTRSPSNTTYDRFLLFSLLPNIERLLYIDSDVIVRKDLSELYDTEIGDAQLAAVTDWIMTRSLGQRIQTAELNVPDLREYQRDRLGMDDEQIARYFNAGVLLFNFKAIEDTLTLGKTLIAEAETGRFLFRDQDILNKHFKSSLHVLDARWNVFNSINAAYGKVPKANHSSAMAARKDPWIIHYADGEYKPWNEKAVHFSADYWNALARTPFFSEVASQLKPFNPNKGALTDKVKARGRQLILRNPKLRPALLKLYQLYRKSGAK